MLRRKWWEHWLLQFELVQFHLSVYSELNSKQVRGQLHCITVGSSENSCLAHKSATKWQTYSISASKDRQLLPAVAGKHSQCSVAMFAHTYYREVKHVWMIFALMIFDQRECISETADKPWHDRCTAARELSVISVCFAANKIYTVRWEIRHSCLDDLFQCWRPPAASEPRPYVVKWSLFLGNHKLYLLCFCMFIAQQCEHQIEHKVSIVYLFKDLSGSSSV